MDMIDIRCCLEIGENVGLAPAVDRLLRISDVKEDLLHAEDAVEDIVLFPVRVLEFVDEDRVELRPQATAQAFRMHGHAVFRLLPPKGLRQLQDHIIESDHPPGGLLTLQCHRYHFIGRTGDQVCQTLAEGFQFLVQPGSLGDPVPQRTKSIFGVIIVDLDHDHVKECGPVAGRQ